MVDLLRGHNNPKCILNVYRDHILSFKYLHFIIKCVDYTLIKQKNKAQK